MTNWTSKMQKIWHPWTDWECYAAGMYDGGRRMSQDDGRMAYAEFLRDIGALESAIERVFAEWPKSCEHFLTGKQMNRVAWLGQASMCIANGVSRAHRGGFMLLTDDERKAANEAASMAIERWLQAR